MFVTAEAEAMQTEGFSLGHPLSVTLADVHMILTENDVVKPLKSLFYKRYVDGIYNGREKNIILISYNYHPNIKLMIEIEVKKFLDTEIT